VVRASKRKKGRISKGGRAMMGKLLKKGAMAMR
jgi:hypothetical protein